MNIYLFAETPRAGVHHYITLFPQRGEVPNGVTERLSAVREKNSYIGNDFIGVSQDALQTDTGRTGRETLIVVVPGYDIYRTNTQRMIDKLKGLQPKLAKLVTETIDWTKEHPAGSLNRPELDIWQQDLAQLFPNKLPKLNEKGCWIMRHKLLCIVTILIVLVAFLKTISGEGLESLERRGINPGRWLKDLRYRLSGKTERDDLLQSWLAELNAEQTGYNQGMESLRNHLSPAFPKKDIDLQTLLRNLQICFGLPHKENAPLDDLLKDASLRIKVAKLYKDGKIDPLAFVDDNDEKTPWYHLRKNKSDSLRLTETRKFIIAVVAVQKASQHESFQSNNQDQWIHFAKQLSFMEDGKDISAPWNEIVKLEPQFVTEADIAVAKQIFAWLTGDDANVVLKGDSPSNYNEAIQQFTKAKINFITEKETTKKIIVDGKEGDFTTKDPIPELKALKTELETLKNAARALPKPAEQ